MSGACVIGAIIHEVKRSCGVYGPVPEERIRVLRREVCGGTKRICMHVRLPWLIIAEELSDDPSEKEIWFIFCPDDCKVTFDKESEVVSVISVRSWSVPRFLVRRLREKESVLQGESVIPQVWVLIPCLLIHMWESVGDRWEENRFLSTWPPERVSVPYAALSLL